MNLHLTWLAAAALCVVALACGHEVSAPSAAPALEITTIAAIPAPAPTAAAVPAAAASDASPASPASDACIEVKDDLSGTHIMLDGQVFVDETFEHPTRGKTRPYILRLDAPRCAKGIEDEMVTEVAIASSSDVSMKPFVGKHVRLSGDPFLWHTAWHARPIVLWTTSATAQ